MLKNMKREYKKGNFQITNKKRRFINSFHMPCTLSCYSIERKQDIGNCTNVAFKKSKQSDAWRMHNDSIFQMISLS